LVERGRGLAILPLCTVAPHVASGRLSVASVGEPPLRRQLGLVRNPSHVLTHASVTVESALTRVLAALAANGSWPTGVVAA
jgi:DNA-binding transcriptional LysR family regulator